MPSRPTFIHQNSMFDTNPLLQKPKLTPPPSPLQKIKTPFSRTGSPVSFRARSIFRATILVLALVIVVTVTNEWRCASEGCLTRVGFRESSWVGGGSVISESIRNKMNNVVGYIDGDDGRKEGEGELRKDLDEGWEHGDMDAGFSGESVLVDPAEGFTGDEWKEAESERWIDETQGRTLGDEIKAKKPEFLTISDAFPIVKTNSEEEKTVEKIVDGIQKSDGTPRNQMEGYSTKGDSGVEQHAKWEQGDGQEDPVRLSGMEVKNKSRVIAIVDEEIADNESGGVVFAVDKAVAVARGKSRAGGGVSLPNFGTMAMDSSGAMGKQ